MSEIMLGSDNRYTFYTMPSINTAPPSTLDTALERIEAQKRYAGMREVNDALWLVQRLHDCLSEHACRPIGVAIVKLAGPKAHEGWATLMQLYTEHMALHDEDDICHEFGPLKNDLAVDAATQGMEDMRRTMGSYQMVFAYLTWIQIAGELPWLCRT